MIKLYQNRDWLYQKYWNEELNENDISNIFKIDRKIIGEWLHKLSIRIRDRRERAFLIYKKKNKNKPYTDEKILRKRYIEECLSQIKIAELFNVSCGTIGRWLRFYKIHIRSRSEVQINSDYIWSLESRKKLSETQKKRNNPNYNICLICGKKFRTSHKNRKTCSRICGAIRQSKFLTKKHIRKICQYCGEEFEISPSGENQKFCSRKCGFLSRRNKVKKICEICRKTYKVARVLKNTSRFCSMECRNKWQSQFMIGEGNITYGIHLSKETRKKISEANSNPSEEVRKRLSEGQIKYSINPEIIEMRWEKKIHTYCDYCGEPIVTFLCLLNNFKKHFCNKECLYNFTRENPRLGKDNPNYFNGKSNEPYSIEFNEILKRKIRKRDNYICQMCGMTQKENIIRFKEKLSIHHKDYNKNNLDEDNLISLCKICHLKTNGNREYYIEYFKNKKCIDIKQEYIDMAKRRIAKVQQRIF